MSLTQSTNVVTVENRRGQQVQSIGGRQPHAYIYLIDSKFPTNAHDYRDLAAALEASRGLGLDFGSRDYSWDDVLESLQTTSKEYEVKTEQNKIKRVLKNKAMVSTLQSLTDMIPDQNGLSILRGGLRLVFSVGSRGWF